MEENIIKIKSSLTYRNKLKKKSRSEVPSLHTYGN